MPVKSKQQAALCACGEHAFLPLKKGVVLVDAQDSARLCLGGWSVNQKGYAESHRGKLHRLLLGNPEGLHVDHRNHDKLDNRRKNLRPCSNAEGLRNRRAFNRGSTTQSRLKGVTTQNGAWIARICLDGQRHYLGQFASEADAAKAYNAAAKRLHGEFAVLNRVGV